MKCYIVGAGTSLDFRLLNRIRHEFSFACNSIGSIYHLTLWRPTVYALISHNYTQYPEDYRRSAHEAKIVYCREDYVMRGWLPLIVRDFPDTAAWQKDWWSDYPPEWVSSYATSLLPCVQLAIWYGFREIVFVGCEGYDPQRERQHVDGYPDWTEKMDAARQAPVLEGAHRLIAHHTKRQGVKVRFATPSRFEALYDR